MHTLPHIGGPLPHSTRYAMHMHNTQYTTRPTAPDTPDTQYTCTIHNTQPSPTVPPRSCNTPHNTQYAMHRTAHSSHKTVSHTTVRTDSHTQYTIHNTPCTVPPKRVVCWYTLVSFNTQSLNTQCKPYDTAPPPSPATCKTTSAEELIGSAKFNTI